MSSKYFSDKRETQVPSNEETQRFSQNTENIIPEAPLPKYMKWTQGIQEDLQPLLEDGVRDFTPLESQVMDLKAKYPKLTLFVECGYRYRFFGEDAVSAARVLDIALIREKRFLTASVPTFHGPMKYVVKFLERGYKVGIVTQDQTASSGYGRNMARCVTEIYTKSTLLSMDFPLMKTIKNEENDSLIGGIFSLVETPLNNKTSRISMAYLDPKSGRLVYDEFTDSGLRDELSSRLTYLGVSEIITEKLSKPTTALLTSLSDTLTLESRPDYFLQVDEIQGLLSEKNISPALKSHLASSMSYDILRCIGAIYTYLKEFDMEESLCKTVNIEGYKDLHRFMKLSSFTRHNLELFKTSLRQRKGSVFDFLNQTLTKFGSRVLRHWLAYPLIDKGVIMLRQEAIEELISNEELYKKVHRILYRLPDLEFALMSILNKRISPKDFIFFIQEVSRVIKVLDGLNSISQLTNGLLLNIRSKLSGLQRHIRDLDLVHLDNYVGPIIWDKVFKDSYQHSQMYYRVRESLEEIEWSLETYKLRIMRTLGEYCFEFSSVGHVDYLIEVQNGKKVPDSWVKMSSTKASCRYRDPAMKGKLQSLARLKEKLRAMCMREWKNDFLAKLAPHIGAWQEGVHSLAELDALLALRMVSNRSGYLKPVFTETLFQITHGRHPILEEILGPGSPYIPNDTHFNDQERTIILSGPNSGGKSSFLRQTALICILAQCGCYVPAKEAKIPLLDAIFLRTGARDEPWNRKSTFVIELEETADIIRCASSQSLVLLDELGRGTSSYDGLAFAESVLKYLISNPRPYTIFVTHYESIASEFSKYIPDRIKSLAAGFALHPMKMKEDSFPIFLYKMYPGKHKSYGVHVAKLAGLPSDVIAEAEAISHSYEKDFKLWSRLIQELERLVL